MQQQKKITPTVELYHGDALLRIPQLKKNSIDAIITDPPYSSGGFSRTCHSYGNDRYLSGEYAKKYTSFNGDKKDQISSILWFNTWLGSAQRLMRENAVICVFSDWRQLSLTITAMQAAGVYYRGIVVWDKTPAARPQPGRFRNQCEYLVWGSFGKLSNNRIKKALPGTYTCRVNPEEKQHPTYKPVQLMQEIIKICADGGTVLDPFMGSGSTGVAALAQGKKFIGIENDEHYFNISCDRLKI